MTELVLTPAEAGCDAAVLRAHEYGPFMGLSSGAVYVAAHQLAARGYRRIVGVFGDGGFKYLSTAALATLPCRCCPREP